MFFLNIRDVRFEHKGCFGAPGSCRFGGKGPSRVPRPGPTYLRHPTNLCLSIKKQDRALLVYMDQVHFPNYPLSGSGLQELGLQAGNPELVLGVLPVPVKTLVVQFP